MDTVDYLAIARDEANEWRNDHLGTCAACVEDRDCRIAHDLTDALARADRTLRAARGENPDSD